MDGSINFRTQDVQCGTVIAFEPRLRAPAFTGRDRRELERWAAEGDRAVQFDEVMGFATLHTGQVPWSSWGVMRRDGRVVAWNTVTLVDIGQFAGMEDALAAIPGGAASRVQASVLAFGHRVFKPVAQLARRPRRRPSADR